MSVSVETYGAVAGDPTKAAVNAAAFASAFAADPQVYGRDNVSYYTQTITVPSTARALTGGFTLIAAGTASGALIGATGGNTGLRFEGFAIQINSATFPTLTGILTNNLVRPRFNDVAVAGGGNGFVDVGSTRPIWRGCEATGFGSRGFDITSAASPQVSSSYVLGSSTTQHGIAFTGGTSALAEKNTIRSVGGFGISFYNGIVGCKALANDIKDTSIEGINGENVSGLQIVGNSIYFTPGIPTGASSDFGMSVFGSPVSPIGTVTDCVISGNIVSGPAKACIGIADSDQRLAITGNALYNPNSVANPSDPYSRSAIVLYGLAQNIGVGGNFIQPGAAGTMDWQVLELFENPYGAPNFNTLAENFGPAGALGFIKAVGPNTIFGGNQCTASKGPGFY